MRTEADIEAERWENNQFAEMKKKGGPYADLVDAIQMARRARTEAGLDCHYTDDGEGRFTVQQGLKAACHAREDVAATLMLQVKILERLDRQRKLTLWALGVLVIVAIKIFG